jgi:hypothetical protein
MTKLGDPVLKAVETSSNLPLLDSNIPEEQNAERHEQSAVTPTTAPPSASAAIVPDQDRGNGEVESTEENDSASNDSEEDEEDEDDYDSEDEEDEVEYFRALEEEKEEAREVRDKLLTEIKVQLSSHEEKDVFAIGGTMPIPEDSPIAIRWGSTLTSDIGHLCELPIAASADHEQAFEKLLKACQPATFGLGGEEVFDEEYRKAGKMDTKDFSTNFNLAEYNIIDTTTQALVQSVWSKKGMNGVQAELYKLNVSGEIRGCISC